MWLESSVNSQAVADRMVLAGTSKTVWLHLQADRCFSSALRFSFQVAVTAKIIVAVAIGNSDSHILIEAIPAKSNGHASPPFPPADAATIPA